jgi:hypothetical protein
MITLISLFTAAPAATDVTIPLGNSIFNLPGFTPITNIGAYVSQIVGLFLIVASLATLVYLVMGGVQWIMAGSDKSKVSEARDRLTNAIIGLAIVAASWAVFILLNYFFGLGLVGGTGSTGSTGGTGGNTPGTATMCAGNIPIGSCGNRTYNANPYRCLAAGSTCTANGSSYSYPFLCPDNTCP